MITAISAAFLGITALSSTALLCGAVYFYLKLCKTVRSCVEPAAEGELSPLGTWTSAAASTFAGTLFQRLKEHLGGVQGNITRQEKAIQLEMGEATLLENNPVLGVLVGLLPGNIKKRVLNNPAAAAALIGMLGGGFGGGGAPGAGKDGGQAYTGRPHRE